MTAIECAGLDVGYGNIRVLRDVDLVVNQGQILTVLGPNGAGKSSLVLTLAGVLPRLGGDMRVSGKSLARTSARALNRAGVVLVPDSRALFPSMSVRDHLRLAAGSDRDAEAAAIELFPSLGQRLGMRSGQLSGGEQQMLAVARALVQRPRVLLIDELSMGLAPQLVAELMGKLRGVASDTGMAIVIVEQHVEVALDIADEAIVLVHGAVKLREPASALRGDQARLRAVYLDLSAAS